MVKSSTPKASVVVADDEPSMLSLLAQHVRTLGHDVAVAHDGEEAWSAVQRVTPDLVLLDVMMPGMSGWEVCRMIRESPSLKQTAVIMITGIGETLNELTSPLFGADAYLDKPFELVDLDAAITNALAKRRGAIRPAKASASGQKAAPSSSSSKRAAAASPAPSAARGETSGRSSKGASAATAKKATSSRQTPAKQPAPHAKAAASARKPSASSAAAPAKKGARPANKPTSAASKAKTPKPSPKRAASPAKKAAPARKATSPAKKATSSAKKAAPTKKATSTKKR